MSCCLITEARSCVFCELVTKALTCPLCEVSTVPHPEIQEKDQRYCVRCAEPFPDGDLRVITWEHDPYTQDGEGGMVCTCLKCLKEHTDGYQPA
jgi:hypothetical protein